MRAVTIREQKLSVEEHPDPSPGAGEVLVRVRGAGLNGADMMQLRGHYPAPPGAPQDIPGLELAGEVVELGERADRFSEGDLVMSIVAGGGQTDAEVTAGAGMQRERRPPGEHGPAPVSGAVGWRLPSGQPRS